jgi:AbrB family looped-hinge helix DNA binding protein
MATTVTLSSKNQIVVPKEAREKLNIGPGQELLVLVKGDRIVLIPRPQDFVSRMAGLHKEVWADVDTDSYLEEERDSWQR